jgi:hypothetical protein
VAHIKYWQLILENLRKAEWNCGSMMTTDGKGRSILIVAAKREGAGRFIVEADQELPAFLELESAIRAAEGLNDCKAAKINLDTLLRIK